MINKLLIRKNLLYYISNVFFNSEIWESLISGFLHQDQGLCMNNGNIGNFKRFFLNFTRKKSAYCWDFQTFSGIRRFLRKYKSTIHKYRYLRCYITWKVIELWSGPVWWSGAGCTGSRTRWGTSSPGPPSYCSSSSSTTLWLVSRGLFWSQRIYRTKSRMYWLVGVEKCVPVLELG